MVGDINSVITWSHTGTFRTFVSKGVSANKKTVYMGQILKRGTKVMGKKKYKSESSGKVNRSDQRARGITCSVHVSESMMDQVVHGSCKGSAWNKRREKIGKPDLGYVGGPWRNKDHDEKRLFYSMPLVGF